ncbi:DUF6515 family protein [Luteimonas sp. SX5]|uniref:DUF6515 family protein n=1 Tax=Luteimonas galliterrae TaxID=2940486 RepID=A0ABT0MGE8_9GAMM|nr:DUF6515 family protein [Luteimonas galliterrae]MCL1633962.1 DUF6515 family protein [Luteimonas galliterrae]
MNIRTGTSWRLLAAAMLMSAPVLCAISPQAEAQRRAGGHVGGGHAGTARASAPTSVNHQAMRGSGSGGHPSAATRPGDGGHGINSDASRTANYSANQDVNRNTNINNNTNINRNVNVNIDDHDHWNDWDDRPFATAAAVTAGVAVTSAVIGSIVYSVPPSCTTVIVDGIGYSQCGSTWYQPRYSGTTVQYVVVNPP